MDPICSRLASLPPDYPLLSASGQFIIGRKLRQNWPKKGQFLRRCSNPSEKITQTNSQRLGNSGQGINGNIFYATLYMANEDSAKISFFCQLFLAQLRPLAVITDRFTQLSSVLRK
jgi:hypothetical protein